MNEHIDYQVVLVDELVDEEIALLRDKMHLCGIKEATFNKCIINFITDLYRDDVFGRVAAWLSYIGADRDIFCIRRVETYYTDYTSPEVKELLRTRT